MNAVDVPYGTIKTLSDCENIVSPLEFPVLQKACHKVNPRSQPQWREHRHSVTVLTLHIILQDLCEHQEQSLLKAPHCLWVCLARYPYRQAD